MKISTIKKLKAIAEDRQTKIDPSHDFNHITRVLNNVITIGKSVGADLDVLIPAALFHDIVVYKKNTPQSKNETKESAEMAGSILSEFKDYPKDKINIVKTCIMQCSFTKAIVPDILESKVLQDADLLESVGAISIMRTFSSGGIMNRTFYNCKKPLIEKYEKNFPSGAGLFYKRLLVVEKRMHTKLAKKMAKNRTLFLKKFLEQWKSELSESGIIK